MIETIQVGELNFEVRRSARRKTLGLTVDRGGELVVHAPEAYSTQDSARWTESKLLWVHRKLASRAELVPRVREPEFVSGESFAYLGRVHRLVIVAKQEVPFRFDGRRFSLSRESRTDGKVHFRRWFRPTGRAWLTERMPMLSRLVGRSPSRIEVRDLGFHWGSCGKSGVLYFDWRLFQLPVRLIDYVVVHELTHLDEPHHGPTFWKALDRSMPDWRRRREELTTKARDMYWCHPNMNQ